MNSVTAWLLDSASAACEVEFLKFVLCVLYLAENIIFDSFVISLILSLSVSVVCFTVAL